MHVAASVQKAFPNRRVFSAEAKAGLGRRDQGFIEAMGCPRTLSEAEDRPLSGTPCKKILQSIWQQSPPAEDGPPWRPLALESLSALVFNLWLVADSTPFWLWEAALRRRKHNRLLRQRI